MLGSSDQTLRKTNSFGAEKRSAQPGTPKRSLRSPSPGGSLALKRCENQSPAWRPGTYVTYASLTLHFKMVHLRFALWCSALLSSTVIPRPTRWKKLEQSWCADWERGGRGCRLDSHWLMIFIMQTNCGILSKLRTKSHMPIDVTMEGWIRAVWCLLLCNFVDSLWGGKSSADQRASQPYGKRSD